MNIVAYSDSEDSGNDAPAPKPPAAAKPVAKASLTSKPAFQKVVDRANPNKIKINLPVPSNASQPKDDIDADAPPAKKARIGGGAFSSFNAMLPAPKKAAPAASTSTPAAGTKRALGKGLGAGVNLRTGAAPAFSREPVEVPDYGAKEEDGSTATTGTIAPAEPKHEEPEIKLVGKPMMFRPLSVANKKKKRVLPAGVSSAVLKKAPTVTPTAASSAAPIPPKSALLPAPKPRISLFSITPREEEVPEPSESTSKGDYTPLLHLPDDEPEIPEPAFSPDPTANQNINSQQASTTTAPQTLSSIANDLNLSPHELRQLMGRNPSKNADLASINITTFNTDAEYAHNEILRQAGETVQHHALKSIAGTGKNSLKSLVNVASTQKEALEEHFAAGRRNKKEAGGKYGW